MKVDHPNRRSLLGNGSGNEEVDRGIKLEKDHVPNWFLGDARVKIGTDQEVNYNRGGRWFN